YIDLVEKSVKDIIKDEVKSQLPHIPPKEVYDYATPMIQSSKTSKDVEPSRGSKLKESKLSSSKGSKSQSKSSRTSAKAEEPLFKTADTEMPLNQGEDLGNSDDQPNIKAASKDDCKPLPLIENQGRQVVPANYFINNDLAYLKGRSSSRKYTTSTTKTKDAKYDTIEGIEYMVPSLWSPMKVAYNKYAIWGITHWVTHVKVIKWYDYMYLEENVVRREDQQLYKFYEGKFSRLNLRDIEDLLLLLVQKKLSNLKKMSFLT
nr:hypothetical protein [Tanacetum cinerariifolium]